MGLYLKVLNWSLDTSKADALLARLPRAARKPSYYAFRGLLVLVVVVLFMIGTGAAMKALGMLAWNGAITFVLALAVGSLVAYGAAKLIGFVVDMIGGGF